jgi:hypothetical protein
MSFIVIIESVPSLHTKPPAINHAMHPQLKRSTLIKSSLLNQEPITMALHRLFKVDLFIHL